MNKGFLDKFKYLLEVIVVIISLSLIIAAAILFFYSVGCVTTSTDIDQDPIIFRICLEKCSDRYVNNQGTKHYARISPDVIRCVCITPTGDHRLLFNYEESSVEGKTNVIVE